MSLIPICSSACREHIQRVFLDSVFSLVFSITNELSIPISSGNEGVHQRVSLFLQIFTNMFPYEDEETFYSEFFHRSWREFLLMNSSSMKIDVLVVVHASLCVQCKFLPLKIV